MKTHYLRPLHIASSVILCAFMVVGAKAAAGSVASEIAPSKGIPNKPPFANIVGSGLRGTLKVVFGQADAPGATNPGNGKDQTIQVPIPVKFPADPSTVRVRVWVDNTEASYPNGDLIFEYKVPDPLPIASSTTVTPPVPPIDQGFSVTVEGTNFVVPQPPPPGRVPDMVYAIGPVTQAVRPDTYAAGSVTATFPRGVSSAGLYTVYVSFSDGASLEAGHFTVE